MEEGKGGGGVNIEQINANKRRLLRVGTNSTSRRVALLGKSPRILQAIGFETQACREKCNVGGEKLSKSAVRATPRSAKQRRGRNSRRSYPPPTLRTSAVSPVGVKLDKAHNAVLQVHAACARNVGMPYGVRRGVSIQSNQLSTLHRRKPLQYIRYLNKYQCLAVHRGHNSASSRDPCLSALVRSCLLF